MIVGTLAVVCLTLDANWPATALGLMHGLYMTAFALNLGNVAEPIAADLNRIRERWAPSADPVSIRERRIQGGLLALFGFVIAGLALAGV